MTVERPSSHAGSAPQGAAGAGLIPASLGASPAPGVGRGFCSFEFHAQEDGHVEPPTEILLWRKGKNFTTKGVYLYDDKARELVLSSWAEWTGGQPQKGSFDYEHDMWRENLPGYLKLEAGSFDVEDRDGDLWLVNIRWTDRAAEMIRKREKRGWSGAFNFEKDTGRFTRLWNVGLTSLPATHDQTPMGMNSGAAGALVLPPQSEAEMDAALAAEALAATSAAAPAPAEPPAAAELAPPPAVETTAAALESPPPETELPPSGAAASEDSGAGLSSAALPSAPAVAPPPATAAAPRAAVQRTSMFYGLNSLTPQQKMRLSIGHCADAMHLAGAMYQGTSSEEHKKALEQHMGHLAEHIGHLAQEAKRLGIEGGDEGQDEDYLSVLPTEVKEKCSAAGKAGRSFGLSALALTSAVSRTLGAEDFEALAVKATAVRDDLADARERLKRVGSSAAETLAAQRKAKIAELCAANLMSPATAQEAEGLDPASGAKVAQPWSLQQLSMYERGRRESGAALPGETGAALGTSSAGGHAAPGLEEGTSHADEAQTLSEITGCTLAEARAQLSANKKGLYGPDAIKATSPGRN